MTITAMTRTLFIGDVHGCSHELQELLDTARPDRVLLTGDLFTRGPDPVGVWELVQAWNATTVLGNHEARMLERWDRALAGEGGGKAGATVRAMGAIPGLRVWIQGLPLSIREPGWLLVHAGVHPEGGLESSTRWQLLNLRRWPDDSASTHPHWWTCYARQHRPGARPLIIHGHDAVQGLRDQRPWSLGLDGGCVFGGALCGYLLEEDRVLRVPAQRTWLDPKG